LPDELAPQLDAGAIWQAFIADLTGGTDDHPQRGVNILLTRHAAPIERNTILNGKS
jgi:hypothetical protein